jgi:hypothetical protein
VTLDDSYAHYFVTDNFYELVVETGQNGGIIVDPQCMWNCWDMDQREEILSELFLFLCNP